MFDNQKCKKRLVSISIAAALGFLFTTVSLLTPVLPKSVFGKSTLEKSDKKPSFEFGLIADIQYCDYDSNGV